MSQFFVEINSVGRLINLFEITEKNSIPCDVLPDRTQILLTNRDDYNEIISIYNQYTIGLVFSYDEETGILSCGGPYEGAWSDTISSLQNIVSSEGVVALLPGVIRVRSATEGNVDIVADPQIVPGIQNRKYMFMGIDNTRTVTFFTGRGLKLDSGESFTLGYGDILEFVFKGETYFESLRKNNI